MGFADMGAPESRADAVQRSPSDPRWPGRQWRVPDPPRHGDDDRPPPDCRKRYERLNLSEVDLGYAGRLPHEHPALGSLQRLSTGDRVGLKRDGERFLIVNDDGHVVGRLARKYRPPEGLRFIEGRVFAIVTRKEDDATDEFRGGLLRASWEVVVPELVFGPEG